MTHSTRVRFDQTPDLLPPTTNQQHFPAITMSFRTSNSKIATLLYFAILATFLLIQLSSFPSPALAQEVNTLSISRQTRGARHNNDKNKIAKKSNKKKNEKKEKSTKVPKGERNLSGRATKKSKKDSSWSYDDSSSSSSDSKKRSRDSSSSSSDSNSKKSSDDSRKSSSSSSSSRDSSSSKSKDSKKSSKKSRRRTLRDLTK